MSVVLAVGLMPLPAYAETGDLVAGSVDVLQQGEANGEEPSAEIGDSEGENNALHTAEPALTAQTDGSGTYESPDGWHLEYVTGSDDIGTGLIITKIAAKYGQHRNVVIPAKIDEVPVIGIGADYEGGFGWANSGDVDTLTIPSSVRFMNRIYFDNGGWNGVFFDAGSSITKLYPDVFRYYQASSIQLPNGIEAIYDRMFQGSKITSFAVPSAAKYIGERAFDGCEWLTSITLNEGLERIDKEAFAHVPNDGTRSLVIFRLYVVFCFFIIVIIYS